MGLGRIALDADMVGFTVVLPVVAGGGDVLFPFIDVCGGNCMVVALKSAAVLLPALFRAGGILVVGLMLGAEVLAMDDLLQLIIGVGIPQGRVAAHSGQLFFGIVFAQILAILFATRTICRKSLLQFDQDMISDVDAGAGNCRIRSAFHIIQPDISVFSTINVDRDGFSITGFAANGINATMYRVDMGIIFDGDARIAHIARIVEITFISYRSTVLAGSVFNGGIALNDDLRA